MSGSESWPKKVELTCAHKNTTTTMNIFIHNNGACKPSLRNNFTTLIYSLVNGLYKITTEFIKLVLDVRQFGASSNLIVPTPDVQEVSFSSSTHSH